MAMLESVPIAVAAGPDFGGEDAVAEIGFGDRAEGDAGAGFRQSLRFVIGHVGGVNEAPAGVDRGVVEQPGDGAGAVMGPAGFDFGLLFGDVEVDGGVRSD